MKKKQQVLIITGRSVRKDDRFTAQICTRGERKEAEKERNRVETMVEVISPEIQHVRTESKVESKRGNKEI
jgi:hypothetical protein